MVVGAGTYPPGGGPNSSFWRSNNADTAANFNSVGGAAVDNYCTGQCWYDNLVVIPSGSPDAVYLGGSYQYSVSTVANPTAAPCCTNECGWYLE